MKSNRPVFIKKSVFLESVERVYADDSIDYLFALRDALSIIIKQRRVGGCKPYDEVYKGMIKL